MSSVVSAFRRKVRWRGDEGIGSASRTARRPRQADQAPVVPPKGGNYRDLSRRFRKLALGRVLAARDRRFVGGRGIGRPAQAPEQIRADRVEQMIVARAIETVRRVARAPPQARRPPRPPPRGSARPPAPARTRAADRRAAGSAPVGRRGGRRIAVDRVDGRLNLIGPGPIAAEAAPDDRLTLRDEPAVPRPTILIGQQHEVAVGIERAPRGATRPAASARAAPAPRARQPSAPRGRARGESPPRTDRRERAARRTIAV